MYSFGGSVGNYQYLIQDLLYTTVLAAAMGFTEPARRLTASRPPARLMAPAVWLPVAALAASCAAAQLAALALLARQPW
jgi:cation-transporting ATPase 13A2